MALNIVGTFPILNSKTSQTDEYGFDYVSYEYTIKTVDLLKYNIKKDDVFTGIEDWIPWNPNPISRPSAFVSGVYVVDTVENENMAGGLTRLTVNTIGTKNSIESNPPRVSLISGGPLIFGLFGTPPKITGASADIAGYGVSGVGQSIEIKFLANGGADGQQEVFAQNFASLLPLTFRGISLPVPARLPHRFSNVIVSNNFRIGVAGFYYGYVCKTILTEKRGSLLLVTLTFSEAGVAVDNGIVGGQQVEVFRYNFPVAG
jgi:hypothetical protein